MLPQADEEVCEAMLVSIVIPIYNAEQHLAGCLDGVLAQSYSTWQAILVDDGSTDQSGAIAEAYGQKDSRFRVIHKENEGQSKARLDGICAAEGEIVMFLDSDDSWSACCLEKVVEAFCDRDTDIVMFPARVVETDGTVKHLIGNLAEQSGYLSKQVLYENVIRCHDLNSLWLKAFRTTVMDVEALRKTACRGVRIGEDKLMLLPLITGANRIYYLNEALYTYLHHDKSISHRYLASKIPEMIAKPVFEETGRYMKLWGMDDGQHRRILGCYYLRNLMSCYYTMRKSCTEPGERKAFRQYPWKKELGQSVGSYLQGKELSFKEKLKLLFMRLSV